MPEVFHPRDGRSMLDPEYERRLREENIIRCRRQNAERRANRLPVEVWHNGGDGHILVKTNGKRVHKPRTYGRNR